MKIIVAIAFSTLICFADEEPLLPLETAPSMQTRVQTAIENYYMKRGGRDFLSTNNVEAGNFERIETPSVTALFPEIEILRMVVGLEHIKSGHGSFDIYVVCLKGESEIVLPRHPYDDENQWFLELLTLADVRVKNADDAAKLMQAYIDIYKIGPKGEPKMNVENDDFIIALPIKAGDEIRPLYFTFSVNEEAKVVGVKNSWKLTPGVLAADFKPHRPTESEASTPLVNPNRGNPRPPLEVRASLEPTPTLAPKPGTSTLSNTLLYVLLALIGIAAMATVLIILKARKQ